MKGCKGSRAQWGQEPLHPFKKYQQELSWIGGNLNQVVKRANELAIIGELTQSYFDDILFSQVREIQELICEVKNEQYQIVKKIIRR